MSATYTLSSLQNRITDIRSLLQHRSRAAQAAFGEALQRWSSPRGRGFAAEHIDPQLRLLGSTSDALLALSRALEAAVRHAQSAEEHLAQARLVAGDIQPAQDEAGRLVDRARQLAELARDRIGGAEAASRRISSALHELGAPPA